MEVLLDTSFILSCLKQRIQFIDLISENYGKILVPEQVLRELESIFKDKDQKLKDRDAAALALQLVEKLKLETVDLETEEVDEGIVEYSKQRDMIVATLDKPLKRKLKGHKIMIITDTKKIVLDSKA
ncbi:MAG: PIN domain-containing protein [archaeon]